MIYFFRFTFLLVLVCLFATVQSKPILTVIGKGTQNYKCTNGAYVLQSANADLKQDLDGLRIRGTHQFNGAYPRFEINGGVMVMDQVTTSAVRSGNIPHATLRVVSASGFLAPIKTGIRSNTQGGVPPAGPCKINKEIRVRYIAEYSFY